MWSAAAVPYLVNGWPTVPFDVRTMSLDGILLLYGHMPRGVVALFVGAALGLSGALLQIVLRNPIADPSTLGVSAGAQLALVTATLLLPQVLGYGRWPVAAVGAFATLGLIMAIGAAHAFHPVTMVITGMLFGLFSTALATSLTLAQGEYLFSLVVWTGGSLVQTSWHTAISLALVFSVSLAAALFLRRPLEVLSLGGEAARALGLPVAGVRATAITLAGVLAATIAAAVGLVGFVGLAAPAIARALGARTIKQILVYAPLCGALLVSLCDGAVMTLANRGSETFPTGAITGLIGAPVLLLLLTKLRTTPPPADAGPMRRTQRVYLLLLVLVLFAVGISAISLGTGRFETGWALLTFDEMAAFLPGRWPRLLGALAAGGLLAMSGMLLQRVTGNALAAPEVLGISGGAAIGYAIAIFFVATPTTGILFLATGLGGLAAMGLVVAVFLRTGARPERLLLAGIAVSAMASAVLSLIMASGSLQSFAVLAWLSGSAGAVTAAQALVMVAALSVLIVFFVFLLHWLAILPLGASVARSLGVPVVGATALIVVIAGLAAALATIVVGPLSFVGLMAPHLARRMGLVRVFDHLVGTVLIGGILMLIADFGARNASFPYELPLGLFASLIGTPWLLWLILRRQA